MKIVALMLTSAAVYVLSFGPAVAIDQTIYNGNKLNGAPYGSVQLIELAYPIQTEIRKWPYFGDDPGNATRRLLESYDSQWRYVGSSTRVFLDGFAAELTHLCGID
ncbi:hypothetical protein [Roseiconus lacunae]|uniref:Uncharacterized protein n=1 Tax=Roseiconus lacunae TaxID=2605694 RepID=A0ABT7PSQ7_9BACT|nr:hypothetical protein [Roseiconus lacunae]MDM4019388.1 hypothetical protein [Roseiconus lacunae]